MPHIRFLALTAVVAALAVAAPGPVAAAPAAEWRVTTVAGFGAPGYSGDGWPATEARLAGSTAYAPRIAVTTNGTLYVAEWGNNRLRRVTPDGVIDTVPGTSTARGGFPRAVAVTADGTAYLATEAGLLRVGAGGATKVPTDGAGLLTHLAADRTGNLYYSVSSFDSGPQRGAIVRADRSGGTRTIVREKRDVYSIAVAPNGIVYYTTGDSRADSRTVYAVGPDGRRRAAVTLPAGHLAGPVAIAPDGTPHVVDVTRGRLLGIGPRGALTQLGPDLAGQIDDLTFRPDGTPYFVVGASVRRLERATGEEAAPSPARSRWANDAPGTVHRVAGTGAEPAIDQTGLSAPAVGPDGTVYVAQPHRNVVHAIGRDGRVERFAGTGRFDPDVEDPHAYDSKTAGKKATSVDLAYPHAVAAGADGNVYIATRHGILRVAEDGTVDTAVPFDHFAGGAGDLALTHQLAVDDAGTVYYTETSAPAQGVVRKSTGDGDAALIAGDGGSLFGRYSDNKPAVKVNLRDPTAVSVGEDGTVYFIETLNGTAVHAVRAIRPDGILVTVVGNVDFGLSSSGNFAGDGGPATRAALNNPLGVAAGPDGSCYVADSYNGRVRRVERGGVITTVAGTGRRAETGDGGPATGAALVDPTGLAVADGTVYVTSSESTRVRAISPEGTISTLADLGETPAERPFAQIHALDVGPDGSVYVGARDGVTSLAPDGAAADVRGLAALSPIAVGRDGSVYQVVQEGLADPDKQSAQLWRRYPDGTVVRLAADQPLTGVTRIAVGPDDQVYVASGTEVFRIEDGHPERLMSTLDKPVAGGGGDSSTPDVRAIAAGPDGRLYVVAVHQVFAVRDGKTELVAGNGDELSTDEAEAAEDGGPARDATLKSPSDVAVAGDGTVFVATADGVRRVRDGVIETIDAGEKEVGQLAIGPSGDLYAASAARISVVIQPAKVTVDRTSWTWVWFAAGAVVVLLAAGLLLHRRWSARRRAAAPADGDA